MKTTHAIALLAFASLFASAAPAEDWRKSEDGVWTFLDAAPAERADLRAWIRPESGSVFTLDFSKLQPMLKNTPREVIGSTIDNGTIITIPTPDGSFEHFQVVESPIWEPGFELQNPGMMTYMGQGIDSPASTIRMDWTPQGFHASVLSPEGAFYVDPWWKFETTTYSSYWVRDYRSVANEFKCHFEGATDVAQYDDAAGANARVVNGAMLKQYRLACAANVEYSIFQAAPNAPTVAISQAAVVTCINRVNQIYERDLSVRLNLVANNSSLMFIAENDGYTNGVGGTLLNENQAKCDAVIGSANYDVGHVVNTGGGGLASLAVVCNNLTKARGETGSSSPTGDPFWIDYVAHELGHQFGGNHTFNSSAGSCGGGNRNAGTAYEPGSGTSIQAYAGICNVDNLQPNSDAFFHHASLDEMVAHITGAANACAAASATGNTLPTVNAGADFTVPFNTPFQLTAVGTDPDPGTQLTYSWEERDLGVTQPLASADNGTSPLFRSFLPTASPTRILPRPATLVTGVAANDEKLPQLNRTSNWRCVVRDNKAGSGGIGSDDIVLTFTTAAGPFVVTSPNTAVKWNSNQQTVTWNVANTAGGAVNSPNVNILLSTDGGLTFPITLVAGTPNDGSQVVTVPTLNTTQARIKVESATNVFFDISNANFDICLTPAGGLKPVAVIGHPNGLPSKIAFGCTTAIQTDTDPAFFLANLDTAPVKSGSPVFDVGSYKVLGNVSSSTSADFTNSGGCAVSTAIADNGGNYTLVTKASQWNASVPDPATATMKTVEAALETWNESDFYKFTLNDVTARVTVTLTPIGTSYVQGPVPGVGQQQVLTTTNGDAVNDMSLELRDTDGVTVLARAQATAAGRPEIIPSFDLSQKGSGPFFIRVYSQGGTDNIQRYQLALKADAASATDLVALSNFNGFNYGETDPGFTSLPGTLDPATLPGYQGTAPAGTTSIAIKSTAAITGKLASWRKPLGFPLNPDTIYRVKTDIYSEFTPGSSNWFRVRFGGDFAESNGQTDFGYAQNAPSIPSGGVGNKRSVQIYHFSRGASSGTSAVGQPDEPSINFDMIDESATIGGSFAGLTSMAIDSIPRTSLGVAEVVFNKGITTVTDNDGYAPLATSRTAFTAGDGMVWGILNDPGSTVTASTSLTTPVNGAFNVTFASPTTGDQTGFGSLFVNNPGAVSGGRTDINASKIYAIDVWVSATVAPNPTTSRPPLLRMRWLPEQIPGNIFHYNTTLYNMNPDPNFDGVKDNPGGLDVANKAKRYSCFWKPGIAAGPSGGNALYFIDMLWTRTGGLAIRPKGTFVVERMTITKYNAPSI